MLELVFTVGMVVFLSALCSLSEAVLYAVPISHIESMADSGHPSGRILQTLRRNVERPIAAILSLNTLANTAGAAVAGALAVAVLGSKWVFLFSALLTMAILIFSEIIPKTAGVVYSRQLAPVIARPLQWLVVAFSPMVRLSQSVTRLISAGATEAPFSDAELLSMARLGLRTGSIKADEVEVIKNVLSLEAKKVRSIMTPRKVVFSLPGDMTLGQAQAVDGIVNVSRIPIFEESEDNVIGIVHRRELLSADSGQVETSKLIDLIRPVDFVPDSLTLDVLLKRFLESRQHMLVVVNEFNDLAGVVTLEDVLEELLGKEIVDEFDEHTDLRKLARERRQKIAEQIKHSHQTE